MENLKMKDYLKDIDNDKLQYVFDIKEKYEKGILNLLEAQNLLKEKVKTLKASEIAYIEQSVKEFEIDECKKEDIQGMLKLFDGIFIENKLDLDEDHPISRYKQENIELEKIMKEIEDLVQYPVIKNQWYELYEKLSQIRIHYSRKQNQLYSILEKKGFDRPTTTMWTLDDFIRDEIKSTIKLLDENKEEEFIKQQSIIINDVRDLISKEETILYPTSLDLITKEEFDEMKSGDDEIGYAWINVNRLEKENKKPENITSDFQNDLIALLNKHGMQADMNKELDVATGKLTLEQINLIYKHMPVDFSYVDENEIVKFYTDTEHRVFPRSKNVIGRDVKNCHPRASVHIVQEIIEKFRNGEQSKAEFWINKPDLFIYIVYFAVRDENGKFKGILEMMQDATHIRKMEGSRTLLTWENEQLPTENIENNTSENTFELNKDTKIKDIFEKYPYLKEELIKIYPDMKILNTPLARVMLPKATISSMVERLNISLDTAISSIKEIIKRHEN